MVLLSCGSPRIDGSSKEAYTSSLGQMRDSLDVDTRKDLDDAIAFLGMKTVFGGKSLADIASMAKAPEVYATDFFKEIDGMTAGEIIARYEKEKEKQKREALKAEKKAAAEREAKFQELAKQKALYEKGQKVFQDVKILKTVFSAQESRYSRHVNFEITVKNETDQPLSRIYLQGRLISEGRSVPWHEGALNYEIPGGLNPGETQTWRLRPNSFSGWAKKGIPDTASLKLRVVDAKNASGDSLNSSKPLSRLDEVEFDRLKSELGM